MNQLFFGDNLQVLRDNPQLPDESVDLIYLDPPFKSNSARRWVDAAAMLL